MSNRTALYNKYLAYYSDVNVKIHNIDLLPYTQRSLPNVVADRTKLVGDQQALYPIFNKDYAADATLGQYQQDSAATLAAIAAAYADAMGTVPPTPPPPPPPTPPTPPSPPTPPTPPNPPTPPTPPTP